MSIHKEFTIDLILKAALKIFTKNTMAKFSNQLAQPLLLDGDWQVALASISFPSNFNNVNSDEIVAYVTSDAELDASHTRTGQLRRIHKGIYNSSEELLEEIFRIAQLKQFGYEFDNVTQKLVSKFEPNEGFSFEDEEVRSILGFKETKDTLWFYSYWLLVKKFRQLFEPTCWRFSS